MSEHPMKIVHLTALLVIGLGCSLGVGAESLELSAPAKSDDGSFVLRISDGESQVSGATQQQLEVYRNKDGGEFRRILVGPRFAALSELVREDGVYGYKVRRVYTVKASEAQQNVQDAPASYEFSDAVYVKVSTSVPRMVAPRNDRLVSSLEPLTGAIN